MDVSAYVKDSETLEFVNEICLALSEEYLNEVHLIYNGKHFSIEPVNSKIVVFYDSKEFVFNNLDDLFFNFCLDGKLFIERINEIYYD